MKIVAYVSIVLVCAMNLVADNNLPDAPTAPISDKPAVNSRWNKQLWIATGVNSALKVADLTQTCIALGTSDGHEHWLPAQSCAGVSAWLIGGLGAEVLASWYLNRHQHPKLAVVVQYVSALGSAAAVAYTRVHWNEPGKPSTKMAPQ